jgi:hypothetical protein
MGQRPGACVPKDRNISNPPRNAPGRRHECVLSAGLQGDDRLAATQVDGQAAFLPLRRGPLHKHPRRKLSHRATSFSQTASGLDFEVAGFTGLGCDGSPAGK